ncbi:hypothetical protein ACFOY2_05335 [Nonomuraea purpurea]|uniref:DUF4355 domain-containing protein n=1 Tax=Nonomuraea purpurea TaxID=1849276 RepID=A0ABV8FY58_9ACTN
MADQQDATSADVDDAAIADDDAQAEEMLASAVDDDAGDADEDSADTPEDRPLGPAGEKALQAEKERRRVAERLRRQRERERDDALAELDKLRKAAEQKPSNSGDAPVDRGPDLDAIRKEAQEQAKTALKAEVLKDRVSDKIEVLAAKRAQDPDVVRTLLLAGNEIADFLDGDKIDAEAIKEALDELLEKKPYLAVAAQSAKRFQGSGDGGARKGPQKPAQLTEDDLRRMSPEQIVQAQAEGRFDGLLGVSR